MQNIILFDPEARNHLLPLSATRPIGEFRVGILTIREKWERLFRGSVSYITQEYLQEKFPIHIEDDNWIINGGMVPNDAMYRRIRALNPNDALIRDGELLAARLSEAQFERLIADESVRELHGQELDSDVPVQLIHRLWHLQEYNHQALFYDFELITKGRSSLHLSDTNRVIGDYPVFLEEGAKAECCIFNTEHGPIYLGKNAHVMEGCILRGPVAVGDDAILKMGAKVYGPSSIGPGCRVGGELTRSILFANSNKAHEGYLGDSVIGEWCNLGADSNNSNLKNNYGEVRVWDYETQRFEHSGKQFVGLFMGDHAKCAINTMFNTGTVVGVFANVFGAGFPRNFIPDFAWGGADAGYRTYKFSEACETAERVLSRRNIPFNDLEKAILFHIYDRTAQFRSWEKA